MKPERFIFRNRSIVLRDGSRNALDRQDVEGIAADEGPERRFRPVNRNCYGRVFFRSFGGREIQISTALLLEVWLAKCKRCPG